MTSFPILITLAIGLAAPDTADVPMEEIVVTGTRMEDRLRGTPAAISVIRRDEFEDDRGISLKEGLALVPGVLVQSRAGAQDVRLTIRGFGARGNGERSNAGSLRGIRILSDGIPITDPDGRTSFDLVNLAAADLIEVSRSNVSALYGNASGGIVDLRTNLAFPSPFIEGRSRSGSFGFHREQALAGFTMGFARGTFSLANTTFDGWRAHSKSAIAQAQLRLRTPIDEQTRLGILVDAASNLLFVPGPLTRSQLDADPTQANPAHVDRNERRFHRVGRIGLTLDRALNPTQDLAVVAYVEPKVQERSERNRFRDFTRYHVGGSVTYRLETHLSPEVVSQFSTGVDEAWQDGSINFYTLGPGGTRGDELTADDREGANSAGAFLQEEIRWGRWSARAAARFDQLWYVAENHIEPSLDSDKTFRRWTPKASLSYVVGNHTLFAALGGGVEAPAFNEIDPPAPFDTLTTFNPFLEATYSATYEVGARGDFGAPGGLGRLGYDAALYWIETRNDLVPFDGGAFYFTAGKTRRRGVELGLDWRPVERLAVRSAATLSDNTYTDYVNDVGDFTDNDVAGLPSGNVTAAVKYTLPVGVSLEVESETMGSYFADDANTARVSPYTLWNASVGYTHRMGERTLRGYVAGNNLGDRRHVSSVFINGINGEYFEPGLPRNWSAGLTLGWR